MECPRNRQPIQPSADLSSPAAKASGWGGQGHDGFSGSDAPRTIWSGWFRRRLLQFASSAAKVFRTKSLAGPTGRNTNCAGHYGNGIESLRRCDSATSGTGIPIDSSAIFTIYIFPMIGSASKKRRRMGEEEFANVQCPFVVCHFGEKGGHTRPSCFSR